MDKDTAMRRIFELTLLENWQKNEAVVSEVQKLGKFLFSEGSRGRKTKKIVVWYKDKILVSGTASELEKVLGMKEQTIRNWVRKKYPDRKGRLFKYLEE